MTRMEVELKFVVGDLKPLHRELAALGAEVSEPKSEVDAYYRHPARDFAKTDEALRIRRAGERNFLTYKGPKIDATTKTREEIDLPLSPGGETANQWSALLEKLGFSLVAEVRKERVKAHVEWQGRSVEVSLDEVAEVGTYVELELIADADDIESARTTIEALARRLGLSQGERRSYLELLLLRQDG